MKHPLFSLLTSVFCSYRNSSKFKKVGYENAFIRTLENVVDDMERKIRRQHERLEHDEQYMRKVSCPFCMLVIVGH